MTATHTFLSGVATSTEMNGFVRDPIDFLLNPPTFQLRQATTVQSTVNATPEALEWDTVDIDRAWQGFGVYTTGYDSGASLSRYTFVVPGRYRLAGAPAWATSAAGIREHVWRKNGSAVLGGELRLPPASGQPSVLPARGIDVYFDIGDYLELWIEQTSGGALSTSVASGISSSMTGLWVGTL